MSKSWFTFKQTNKEKLITISNKKYQWKTKVNFKIIYPSTEECLYRILLICQFDFKQVINKVEAKALLQAIKPHLKTMVIIKMTKIIKIIVWNNLYLMKKTKILNTLLRKIQILNMYKMMKIIKWMNLMFNKTIQNKILNII